MNESTELALAVLRLADAIEEGGTNAIARSESVYRARKHAHAIINRHTPTTAPPDACFCQPDRRDSCDCVQTCVCDEVNEEKG